MPIFKGKSAPEQNAPYTEYEFNYQPPKMRFNIWFIILVLALGVAMIASYVLPDKRTGNAAKDLQKETASILKKEAEEKKNPNDGIARFTSEEAPWLSTDNEGTIYIHPEKFKGDTLVIPAEFDGKKIHTISSDNITENNKTIKSLEIAEGIQIIKDSAFENFTSLKSVIIPKSVIHINGTAFHNTPWYEALKDEFVTVGTGVLIKYNGTDKVLQIPETISYIDGAVFKGLKTATVIELPNSAIYIGDRAFQDCEAETITGGNNITFVANNAFFGCSWIDKIDEDFATIGKGCMVKYTITDNKIRIPDTVRQITSLDLEGEGEDVTLIIGANVTRVADVNALGFVKAFKVDKNSTAFSVVSGVLYNKSETTIYRYPVYKTKKAYYAPETLRTIGEYAFAGVSLEKIELYDGVTSVNDHAFYNADNLLELDLPGTIVNLSNFAFLDCDNLKEVLLPEKLSALHYGVCQNCISLEEVLIPDSVTKINAMAFAGCEKMENLFIPKSVALVSSYFNDNTEFKLELDSQNPYLKFKDGKLVANTKK